MNPTQRLEFLKRRVSLCQHFTDDRLAALVQTSRVASFETHEAIAHQGDEASHFEVVLSGTITASALGDGGTRLPLGALGTGEPFGETALMTDNARLENCARAP